MVGKAENVFAFLSLWYDKRFHFPITYLPFSSDVAECVISRDGHEYCGDTLRYWFLLKRWEPSKNCASGPLKASSGTELYILSAGASWRFCSPRDVRRWGEKI